MIIIVFQIDQQIEDMFASVKRVTDVTKPMVNQQGPPSASNLQKLELAKRLASRINMAKNLGAEAQDITQQAAAAIFKGSMPAPSVSVRTIAGETLSHNNGYQGLFTLSTDFIDVGNFGVIDSFATDVFQHMPVR